VFNLVSNAVKYTPKGGSVLVRAGAAGDGVEICVIDDGAGIPQDKLEAIFEPFVQLRREGEVPQGAGLGLAISRDLARGMSGDLTVTSDASGSTFRLRVPRAARQAPGPRDTRPRRGST
jgi:signal transduction histidine kinase